MSHKDSWQDEAFTSYAHRPVGWIIKLSITFTHHREAEHIPVIDEVHAILAGVSYIFPKRNRHSIPVSFQTQERLWLFGFQAFSPLAGKRLNAICDYLRNLYPFLYTLTNSGSQVWSHLQDNLCELCRVVVPSVCVCASFLAAPHVYVTSVE